MTRRTFTEMQRLADWAASLHNRAIGAEYGDYDYRYYMVYRRPQAGGGYYLKEKVRNPDFFVAEDGEEPMMVAPSPAARVFGTVKDPVTIAELHAYLSGLISGFELAVDATRGIEREAV